MKGKFGTKHCSHCGREFDPIRRDQHLCSRECKERYFVAERRRALAAYREMRRYSSVVTGEEAEVA